MTYFCYTRETTAFVLSTLVLSWGDFLFLSMSINFNNRFGATLLLQQTSNKCCVETCDPFNYQFWSLDFLSFIVTKFPPSYFDADFNLMLPDYEAELQFLIYRDEFYHS